ncbi:unnamed protein product [Cylindrotheca closterium]|uniref:Oxidation resistance protein 1 n=1 Tax=Cylindrotheca closterium TaxID=2856 RepID=A0AAD2CML2_9STRA|nr:unnamed protein product [Cylindrotheca closterium]
METESELLSRLQSQFGDMDLSHLLDDKKSDGAESEESSLAEPTAEELRAWQEAQYQKGKQTIESKKSEELPPVQRRRRQAQKANSEDDDDWEQIAALPQLSEPSVFFPQSDESGSEILGLHPLLAKLSAADPEVLGTRWKRLYSSEQGDGLSFAMLLSTLKGYGGPTLMLISAKPSAKHMMEKTSKQSTIGFFTTSVWSESNSFFGNKDCFLFKIDEKENDIAIIRPRDKLKNGNFMYCHPSSLNPSNRRMTSSSATDGCVHGIGVGGSTSQPRLHLTETLEDCRAMEYCSSFEAAELLPNGKDSLYFFDADCIEVWGVGGEEWIQQSLQAQQKGRDLTEATLKKVRMVDKKQFIDDLRFMAKPNGLYEHVNHVDERADL